VPIPSSYRVQEVRRCCELCDHAETFDRQIYCRNSEPQIINVLMRHVGEQKLLRELLEPTRVDACGVCEKFEEIADES